MFVAAFLSVVLITEMLEICLQTSYDQNVQLILKNNFPVVYGTPSTRITMYNFGIKSEMCKKSSKMYRS